MDLRSIGYPALAVMSVLMFGVSVSTLWWMLHDWNAEPAPDEPHLRTASPPHSFSLIVPARHEEAVLGHTLARLSSLDHPAFEIVAVVGHDDPATHMVAARAEVDSPERIRLVVDENWPKSKPKALNTALAHCNGDIIGIFDAEDEVSPDILRKVDAAFSKTGTDVVQAGVQLVDIHSSWFSLRNCLEYYFWYRSRMHAHARRGVVPLGGNTVFFRRELVEAAGGWDPECLAEDCDIGIRLSAHSSRVEVVYDPHVTTREETPAQLSGLIRQRTRWNQGFLQVLRKHDTRAYPTWRQRMIARYPLAFPFLQAAAAIQLPISLGLILFAKLPVKLTLVAFLPFAGTVLTTAAESVALRELCRDFYLRLRWRDYVVLLVSTVPYQVVLSLAAIRAAGRELLGNHTWEKTAHFGSHRAPQPSILEGATGA